MKTYQIRLFPSKEQILELQELSDIRKDIWNKLLDIQQDKYDYTLVDYKNNKTKVKIICKIHGIFEVRPDNHYHTNCPKCKSPYWDKPKGK